MHTVLWVAVAPLTAAQAFDLFTVIGQRNVLRRLKSARPQSRRACARRDHLQLLCSAVAAPNGTRYRLTARFEPVRTLGIMRPINVARRDEITADRSSPEVSGSRLTQVAADAQSAKPVTDTGVFHVR